MIEMLHPSKQAIMCESFQQTCDFLFSYNWGFQQLVFNGRSQIDLFTDYVQKRSRFWYLGTPRLYNFYTFNYIEAYMVVEIVCLQYKWPGYCTALYGTYQTQGKHICPSAKGSQKVLKYKYNHSVDHVFYEL